jgi:betaine-aldehyde dehydrogenase
MHFTLKEPLGVVVSIQPFNFPLCLLAWQAGAALGAGNAMIIKPSELTSITTLVLMKVFSILPPGLVQCITGGGRVGNTLVSSHDTHMVAFTGGIETGQRVARACADQFKPTLIEASGNDAFIVMPSTDLSTAVQGARFAAYLNCGQVCTSAERFFVHESIYNEFSKHLKDATQALRIGNGFDQIDIGPMVTADQRDSYEKIVSRAIEQGANVLCGSMRPEGINKGWFTCPTVLSDISPDMEILQGESFGPVAPLCPVSSLEEAITLTNSSKYGLGATIYTNDLNEAMQAVHEIDTGMVWVNAPLLDNDAGPFGGRKLSGLGSELGPEGLDTFRSSKLVIIDPAASEQDFWWFPYKDSESYSK